MKPWPTLLLSGLLAAAPLTGRAGAADAWTPPKPDREAARDTREPRDARFSQTLSSSERSEAGLDRLSSDQVAVLDALYRRDLATQAAPRRASAPAASALFSQRLSAEERSSAGLALLTADEVARLDTLVERQGAPMLAAVAARPTGSLASSGYVPLSVRARVAEAKAAPEIHGSFTFGLGFGKGYSEQFGGITLNYVDPDRKFALSLSYSESHIKGAGPYPCGYGYGSGLGMGRYGYGYGSPWYDPLNRFDDFSRYDPEW